MKAIPLVSKLFPDPLPSLFFQPHRYRPHGVGYWSGHIPFACDLVHSLEPDLLVELGTHTGESYFTFCQAIAESGITCRANAVDTWRGDQHTGAYSESVFSEVSKWNEQYAHFSTLLRMSFDEAADRFENESIDLLHIDGAHTYEAVRHDFDLWWPKVRAGGVVVMHDSNEKGHGFGVWKLIEELRGSFPTEEFLQSHGLGVVVKPPLRDEPNVATALVSARDEEVASIRRYYESCAAYQRQRYLTERRSADDWDVIAQLFWRSGGEDFSENESVRAAEIVGRQGETLWLPIPPRSRQIRELRVVPTLEAAILRVEKFSIEDATGQCVMQQGGLADGLRWRQRGLQATEGREAVLVSDRTGYTNGFTVPLTEKQGEQLGSGGALYLRLAGLSAFDYAEEVADGNQRRSGPLRRWLTQKSALASGTGL